MNVVMVAPLNPKTGIAKYARRLAGALSESHAVILVDELGMRHSLPPNSGSSSNWPGGSEKDIFTSADVVHFQWGNSHFHHFQNHLFAMIKRSDPHIPVVSTFHDATMNLAFRETCMKCWGAAAGAFQFWPSAGAQSIRRFLIERKVLRNLPYRLLAEQVAATRSDFLVFHSKASIRESSFPIRQGKARVIPQIGYFEALRSTSTRRSSELDIFAPGLSLSPRRGLRLLIEALSRSGLRFHLRIGGEVNPRYPSLRQELSDLSANLGLGESVDFVGFQSEESFVGTLQAADLVVIPRLSSVGEVSAALVHALCAGKPVIASNVGSFPEYLPRGVGALVENQVSTWSETLSKVAASARIRREMGRAALAFADETLSESRVALMHTILYREATRGAGP